MKKMAKEKQELQRTHQKPALEVYQEWQQEQAQKMQEGTLHLQGTMDMYQHAMAPINSVDISRELLFGPPRGLSKAEKKLWKEKMGILHKLSKEREAFFAPIDKIRGVAEEKLKQLKKESRVEDYMHVLQETEQAAALNVQESFFQKQEIADTHPEILQLQDVLKDLHSKSAEDFTNEELAKLAEKYTQSQEGVQATSADRLKEAVRMKDTRAGYVFLMHSVATLLAHRLDRLPADQIKLPMYTRLCGMVNGAGLVAVKLELSENYQKQLQEHRETEQKAKLEQEQRNREAMERLKARRAYLRTGILGQDVPQEWLLGPYAEILEEMLGVRFSAADCTMQEIASKVQMYEQHFRENRQRLREKLSTHEFHILSVHKDELLSRIEKEYIWNLFSPVQEETLKIMIKNEIEPMQNELQRCKKRREYLTKLDGMMPFMLGDLPEEIEILILAQNTEEEFRTQAEQLQKQVKHNQELCQKLIEERLSPVTQQSAQGYLKKDFAYLLLRGTREEIVALFSEEGLKQHMPALYETEQDVAAAMKSAGVSRTWLHAVGQVLDIMDSRDTMKKKLHRLRKTIEENQDAFADMMKEKRYSVSAWRKLLLWHEEKIGLEKTTFCAELQKFADQLEDVSEEKLSLKEYMDGGQTAEEIKSVEEETYASILKRELCGWEGFSDFLEGSEDAVIKALDQVLKQGGLKHAFLENIKSSADLDKMTYTEYQILLSHLRVNMSKAILQWHTLEGMYADQVRINLFPEMLMGKLDEQNFMDRAEVETEKVKNEEKATQFRLSYLMKAGSAQKPGVLQYQYVDDTDSRALRHKGSRATRRLERFAQAHRIWKAVEKFGMTQKILEKCHEIEARSDKDEYLHIFLTEQMRISPQKGAYALYEELSEMKESDWKGYINEIRLCGLESMLLSRENDPEAYQTFTQGKIDEYNEMLQEKSTWVVSRMWELNRVLEETCEPAERKFFRKRFLPLLVGLKKEDKYKKENYERFGVETWLDALGMYKTYLRKRHTVGGYSMADVVDERLLKQVNRRKEQILAYQNGVLMPILPMLLEDKAFWTSMVTDNQKTFKEKLDGYIKRLETPMKLMDERYPYGEEFKRQLIHEYGRKMLFEEEKDRKGWVDEFDAYFNRFCDHMLGGTSIKKRYQEWMEKDVELASCFTEIMLTNPDGLTILSNDKKLKAVLEECKSCMKPNQEALNAFLQQKPELTAGEQAGFKMFLRAKIPFVKPAEFAESLPEWMEEFAAMHKLMTEEMQKETEPVMERRATIFQEIQTKHHEGMLADGKDLQLMRTLRSQIRSVGSPMLAALGTKKMPGQKQVAKAKVALAAYENMPERVKNCLFERLLSGVEVKNVEQEWAWLEWANIEIEKMKLAEHVADELLMFVSVRYHGKQLKPEHIKQAYKDLGERHMKISKMMDPSLALALEFHPKDWEEEKAAVDYQLKRQENPLLLEKRRMVMEAMAVGIYTMEDEYFHALALRQTEHLQNVESADAMFTELFMEQQITDAEEQQMLRIALTEYFHADLMKGQNHFHENRGSIQKKARAMLKEELYRRSLLAGGKMESMGSDSLTAWEKKLHTMDSRETLEQFLGQKKNESFRKKYNQLNREQRQVFALSVLQLDQSSDLPSARFVRSEDLQISRSTLVQMQLEQYAAHKAFKPEIAYDRVMDLLRLEDGSMDAEAFDAAMELTQDYIQRYQEKISADWSRILEKV